MRGILISSIIGTIAGSALAISKQKIEVLRSLTEQPPYVVEGSLASIVVPALEEEKYLPNLLTSIRNQTYRSIEIIVADQSPFGSHKRTEEICWQYGARLIHLDEPNVSRARNEGAKAAMADILIFSDADNILAPACVENLIRALDEGYILANPVHCNYDDDGLWAFGTLWGKNWLKPISSTGCCVGIWRDAYFEIGGYTESCDPYYGCREDLKFGRDIVERFGLKSIKLVRNALVGNSARRFKKEGLSPTWKHRAIRYMHLTD